MKKKEVALASIAGIGLGWLVGMTISSVAPSIIAGLLTALLGIELFVHKTNNGSDEISNRGKFIAVLIFAIAVGTAVGILTRVNKVLAPTPEKSNSTPTYINMCGSKFNKAQLNSEIEAWSQLTGKDKQEVAKQLFSIYLQNCKTNPAAGSQVSTKDANQSKIELAALYNTAPVESCKRLLSKEPVSLRKAMLQSGPMFEKIGSIDMSDESRAELVKILCKAEEK